MALDKDFFSIVRPKICIWLTTMNSIGDKYLLRLLVFMKCLNLAEFNEAFLLEKNATCGTLFFANNECFYKKQTN